MNKKYDFGWLIYDIDNSIIFSLIKNNKIVSNYQVRELLINGIDLVNVEFANTNDLINLINFSVIRFVDVLNDKNIIDIPLRRLYLLYLNSNKLGENTNKLIDLRDLFTFSVYNNNVISDLDYKICVCKINNESDELLKIMKIAYEYSDKGMQEKFDALGEINLINYNRCKNDENIKI